jgi:hypothetical protein
MKIRKLLRLQSLLEERVIPCDMEEMEEVKYFSKSKNEYICILDMDLIHFIRVFRNKEILSDEIFKERLNNLIKLHNQSVEDGSYYERHPEIKKEFK